MALPIHAAGFGTLAVLEANSILSNILSLIYKPLKSVDLSKFIRNTRVVHTPVLDINVMQVSHNMTSASTQALARVISVDSGMICMSINSRYCNEAIWVENVTLACLGSIDWSRFTEVKFEYPRLQALVVPKLFPTVPGGTCGT
ncbi:uncharacterized protein RAG0_03584 [Rhynchosporium agropyri]|uniref:Uncharacterized protein n=1 Tax=Rhynchosporium agropyri TaxID=914238 RepID=A0A1E1K5A8_9HELO|nr:uncharacterized protein RAG0_03584 [Rhynchosporium agropyri]